MNAPPVSIIDTLDDPALFAPWFAGPSWNAWRVGLNSSHDGAVLDFKEVADDLRYGVAL
jgi:hypothetical protein